MSRIKEQFHEEINNVVFTEDYFELISDQEWQEYDEMMKEQLEDKYGRLTGKLVYNQFQKKNS